MPVPSDKLQDVNEAAIVGFQVEVHDSWVKVWVCIDGVCRLRVARAKNLNVNIPGHPDFRFGVDLEEPTDASTNQ